MLNYKLEHDGSLEITPDADEQVEMRNKKNVSFEISGLLYETSCVIYPVFYIYNDFLRKHFLPFTRVDSIYHSSY